MSTTTSSTFKLTRNGKPVESPNEIPMSWSVDTNLKYCDIVRNKKGILLTNTNPDNSVVPALNNSFIGAIFDAYSHHYKLVLRPDDVWLSIIITFADYVNHHAETMREYFVEHEGKNQLVVNIDTDLHIVKNWSGIMKQFSDKINENTIGNVRDWVEPKFTTTTENDSLIARVALLGIMKPYYAIACMVMCGIPEVTLMGTLEDWQQLRHKIDHFSVYAKSSPATSGGISDLTKESEPLRWWCKMLFEITGEFVRSYKGKVNNNFWQSCANSIPGGSGPDYVSGWMLAFAPFDEKGNWRLNTPDQIKFTGEYGKVETTEFRASSTVEVPLKIKSITGVEYEAYFYAGGMVNIYDKDTNTIRPSYDFAMLAIPQISNSDEIDRLDRSAKLVENNKPIDEISSISASKSVNTSMNWLIAQYPESKGRGLTINVSTHEHELHFHTYGKKNRCNACHKIMNGIGYRCEACDYDYCFKCHDKSNRLLGYVKSFFM